ncbi:TIGR03557 family F420-dependent LLM class oxidoreductase [Nocardioides campestrisoli]|uniref:TIGR03557 family F420-dependent LLM class oxidoreductase n=1 Tax=Nocardioides campestrisoli TaxID=2736757 RepID=UPI00163DD6F1|nr:TIGR03557 family F420-dependent LLM class oxidoreductase [Nocardioides campestrisoli]
MRIGYTLMTEQASPSDLVRHAGLAEQAGYDFEVMSDHYFPWLDEQGHSGYAWAMLGAVTQVTSRVELMTYVTCPTFRYHPAVVAQKAATVQLLSGGRFTLGVGSGENLNEHVVGQGWPSVDVRHEMLVEALEIINGLFDGGYVTHHGVHFDVESAKLWDLPETRVPIAAAVSGKQSIQTLAPLSDHMVTTEPTGDLVTQWDGAGARGTRKIGQMPLCFDRDAEAAVQRAHEQFRWFGGGWKVNAELPGTAGFAGASQFVRPEDVAGSIPCGDDVSAVVEAAKEWHQAGFTDLAFIQVGGDHQEEFLEWSTSDLLPALRQAGLTDEG